MARHIENEAARLGYQVVFGSSDEDPEKLEDLIHTFLSRQVDGMIIVPVFQSDEFLRSLQDQPVPFVFIDRYLEGLEADSIVTDNYQGAYQLTRHLCDRGHPAVAAFATLPGLSSVRDRIRGYRAALKDVEGWVINVDFQHSGQGFDHLLEEALHKGCRAFFFTNNKLAISSLKYFHQKGLSVPEDVDIVSFDNTETFQVVQHCIPCLEQPIEEIAARAMEVLSRKIAGKIETGHEQVTLHGTLIHPDTC